jgi:hypothetical protein
MEDAIGVIRFHIPNNRQYNAQKGEKDKFKTLYF